MGIVKFALRGNYKKYYEDLKELSKSNHKSPTLMFIDTGISCLLFKSGLQDYINYKFYEKSLYQRSKYASIGFQHDFYRIAAHWEYAPFFSNKINFMHNFKEYTKRECVSYKDSLETVEKFIKEHKTIIKKPINGLGGEEVEKIYTKDIKDIEAFYKKLKTDISLIEEEVIQNKEWSKLNPDSLNTVRIVTKCIKGNAEILYAVARIGSGKSIVDNFHQGGVGVKVNIEKGCLEGKTIDKKNNESDETSVTHVKVDGFKIPYWNEIKKMCLEASKVNDNVNVVGWDVGITDDGPVIIEGNRGPGMDIIQMLYKRGVKSDLKKIKKEILAVRKAEEKEKKRKLKEEKK